MVLRSALVCALSLAAAAGPGAAAALAGGPGVNLVSSDNSQTITVTGSQIAAAADTGPTSYTLRSSPGSSGRKRTLRGLSISGLLTLAGIDPNSIDFISVGRADGSRATLKRADFTNPSAFPEGPALVTDEGTSSRFFRPVTGATGTNVRDNILASTADGPLDVTVGGGALLVVRASATPRATTVGRTVHFSAAVRFPPPGATFTYRWDFGDGTTGVGRQLSHRYAQDGDLQAQVSVEGTGASTQSCADTCGGVAAVRVRIGTGSTTPKPAITPGTSSANPTAPGAGGAGSGGGGGTGGGGGGTGASKRPAKPAAKPPTARRRPKARPARPAPRADAGQTIRGILLADSAVAPASSLPALPSAGGTPGTRRAAAGPEGGGRLGGSLAVTLVLIAIGALYERRQGRLRLA